ncbi:MAG: ATP-dependent helicase HrpB [Paracoccaceae bacterium]
MLPIEAILPDLIDALRAQGRAVLQVPPGAGKTTRVPLAMLEADVVKGRIVMLEPRRLAARAAAGRMADTLGEEVGQTVGYRIRGEARTSAHTKIEVVTEGILTRMLQSDAELPGIGAVIFDEFHERSLNADLGLALCLEVADTLRDDLVLLAMSATLDADPVAQVMNAPILTSEGRSFPVETIWLPAPLAKTVRLEAAMADVIQQALATTQGSVLAFLPGEGEIRRTESALRAAMSDEYLIAPLFGAMDFKAQQAAIRPAPKGRRKVVLSTAIAETSLTIADIQVVVDGGRARRALYDASSGMSRLVTERVTRAEATQRAGRAGRVTDGTCFKLWTRGEDGALASFPPPEIEAGDLTAFALELALWGTPPDGLRFVTPPHDGRFKEAQAVLRMLGALDDQNRITRHGKVLAKVPLHPRLAHMLQLGGKGAADMAALLSERDPLRGRGTDLNLRIRALSKPEQFGDAVHRGVVSRIRQDAKRLKQFTKGNEQASIGVLAALAYPDRIGMRRKGDAPRYLLSGGKGAILPDGDGLSGQQLIVVTDLDGDTRETRIRQAVPLAQSELRHLYADQIQWFDLCEWSRRENQVVTRQQERFAAIALDDRAWTNAPPEHIALAMLDGVRQLGLRPSAKAARFLSRARLMTADFPDFSDAYLLETVDEWLLPHLIGVRSAADWKVFEILPALEARLDWAQKQTLDTRVPGKFVTPLGRSVPIDYSAGVPAISLRLQEMFGVTQHPVVGQIPLQVTLLSPAQRPVQVTQDIPGFWAESYADVRKDMRGQYPKHPWPEDPTQADPTLRAKRRKP